MKDTKILSIFCAFDDFFKDFDRFMRQNSIGDGKNRRRRKGVMSVPEVMTIVVLFHMSGYRTFKDFYLKHVCRHLRHHFPEVVSYNRMVELQSRAAMPLALFLKMYRMGKCTGVSFIDSTPIQVCHTTGGYTNIKCSKGLPRGGTAQKAGSTASSCTWSTTIAGR